MGTSALITYLSKAEIEEECKRTPTLLSQFNKFKNSDGYLTINEFDRITNKMVDIDILNQLIQITTSSKTSILYDEYKYIYALFHTGNIETKANFILDFIFANKKIVSKEKYITKCERFYSKSPLLMSILADDKLFINNDNGRNISKIKALNHILNNHNEKINKFSFLNQNSKDDNGNEICSFRTNRNGNVNINGSGSHSNLNNEGNDGLLILNDLSKFKGALKGSECTCFEKNNFDLPINNPIQFKEYDKLNKEFRMIEKTNNGIFPIKVLANMLNDVNVKSSVVDLITHYFKKRTQRSFINFEQFTQLFHLLTDQEIEDSLFELLAYPKKEIKKNDLFVFIKATKEELSSIEINIYFSQLDIKDTIDKRKFNEMLSLINQELLDSFEHVRYLPFIYFKQKCPDKTIEKNCIEILMKKKPLAEVLKERIQIEESFWIIDSVFWKKLMDYFDSTTKSQKKLEKKLRINTTKISDKNGRLHEGLVYLKDFFVIGNKMYELFTFWYGPALGTELKRSKILLPDYPTEYKRRSSLKDISTFTCTDNKFNKYEIEIYPVFLLFFNFDELLKKNSSFQEIKENLKLSVINTQDPNLRYYPFSRLTNFISLLKPLSESTGLELELNKTRLWVFYQGKFYQVTMTRTLEDEGIANSAIIVLEIASNLVWPSEKIKKENYISSKTLKHSHSVGLVNIGNTCYMNSVLQIFLNHFELKYFLLENTNIEYVINKKKGARLIKEIINLYKEKYQNEKKTVTPRKFKEICGEYNKAFYDYEQQDAYDFYTFLVDSLHEDINIKGLHTKIENKEKISELEDKQDQGNVSWANNLRNNMSYLHSSFLGQLKSELMCNKCNSSKVSFETFSSLSLPLPEETILDLEVILFRLPFSAKVYYEEINLFVKQRKTKQETIRTFLKNIRKRSLGIPYRDETYIQSSLPRKNYVPLTTAFFEQEQKKKSDNENIFTNAINMNIPLRIRIAVYKKDKCSEIILKLKSMSDLELEMEKSVNNYTYFLIINNNNYVNPDNLIDDSFNQGQIAQVYEMLTTQGIQNLFGYPPFSSKLEASSSLNNDLIPLMLNKNDVISLNDNKSYGKKPNKNMVCSQVEIKEIIITVNQRIILPKSLSSIDYFHHPNNYETIDTYKDYLLLPITNSIKGKDLYNLIWEKYEYFLNNPTKYEGTFWWKKKRMMSSMLINQCNDNQHLIMQNNSSNNNNQTNIGGVTPINSISGKYAKGQKSNCSPFVLKLINKKTMACITCPWFKFCSGCIINTQDNNYITLDYNAMLIVEWCREIYIKEIQVNNNFQLVINHLSAESMPLTTPKRLMEKETQVTLTDCLKLFTQSEDINDVFCEVCSCKSSFKKKYEIERLPKYLVLTLKRFKYTSLYKKKITTLVTFPTLNLNLSQFLCSNSINAHLETQINLFGVINHSGSLTEGHYSTIIYADDRWIKYDDSKVSEYEDSVQSPSVYMLIYNVNINTQGKLYFDYNGLLNSAYKLYLKKNTFANNFNFDYEGTTFDHGVVTQNEGDSEYYFGEPVKTDKGNGYLVNMYEKNGKRYAKIKKKVGYIDYELIDGCSIKESIVIENPKDEDANKSNDDSNNRVMGQKADCSCSLI